MYSHALQTRTRSDSHVFTHTVRVSVDKTSGTSGRPSISVGEEMRWHHGRGRSGSRGNVDGRGLGHRTLVPWTTETLYVLLEASKYGRRAALLEADDVTSETETEVARVVPGYLLGGHVNLATVSVYIFLNAISK